MKRFIYFVFILLSTISFGKPIDSLSSAKGMMQFGTSIDLPYDAEVEWIGQGEDLGEIQTGIVPPVGSILHCRFRFVDTRNSFCACGYLSNRRFGFGIEQGTFKVCTTGWVQIIPQKDDQWHNWTINEPEGYASLDGYTVSIKQHSEFNESDLHTEIGYVLFGRNGGWAGLDYPTREAQVSYLYLATKTSVLFHGIAVRFTNENGEQEGALYDKVSGKLFRNKGRGSFVIGPDK